MLEILWDRGKGVVGQDSIHAMRPVPLPVRRRSPPASARACPGRRARPQQPKDCAAGSRRARPQQPEDCAEWGHWKQRPGAVLSTPTSNSKAAVEMLKTQVVPAFATCCSSRNVQRDGNATRGPTKQGLDTGFWHGWRNTEHTARGWWRGHCKSAFL